MIADILAVFAVALVIAPTVIGMWAIMFPLAIVVPCVLGALALFAVAVVTLSRKVQRT